MRTRRGLAAGLAIGLCAAVAAADVTGSTGGGLPQPTIQPSLGLNYIIRLEGVYPTDGGAGGLGTLGEVNLFAGDFAPAGYQFCNGQLLLIQENTALFSLLGTTYGGNGINTFALPDLRGRVAVGTGSGAGLTPRVLGGIGGAETVTLTVANLPAHSHDLPSPGTVTDSTGSGAPYSNLQPELGLNYMIALNGIFPSPDSGGGTSSTPLIGQLMTTATNVVPAGWALCRGQLLSIQQNTALYSILGTTYGGDGVQTFGLPDLQGRAPIGTGQGNGLSPQTIGQVGGHETLTLTDSQVAPHTHTVTGLSGPTTGSDGGGLPQTNMQPTLGLSYIIALDGIYPSRDPIEEPLLGQIDLFAGNFAPDGWAFCDGQLLPISQNTALFSLLGTYYGGDGEATFALPDLRGQLAVGFGQGPGLSDWFLGERTGTESVTMTLGEMPAHTHDFDIPEPATLSLLAAAGALLLGRRRRPADN